MSLPEKSPVDPQSSAAKPHQSGNHPLAGSAAAPRPKFPKPTISRRDGPGHSREDLARKDVEEYARSHPGRAAATSPGPGLLQMISDGFKGLLKKLTKTP